MAIEESDHTHSGQYGGSVNPQGGEAPHNGGSLADKAKSMAERQMTSGVEAIDSVGRAVRKVAEDLETELPGVAPLVADAARGIEGVSNGLRNRPISELVESVTEFGRKQPATFIAGAVVFGLLLSRFVKSGAMGVSSTSGRGGDDHG